MEKVESIDVRITATDLVSLDFAQGLHSRLTAAGWRASLPKDHGRPSTALGVTELIIMLVLTRLGKAAALTIVDEVERFLTERASEAKLKVELDCQVVLSGDDAKGPGRYPFRVSNRGVLAIKTVFAAIRESVNSI